MWNYCLVKESEKYFGKQDNMFAKNVVIKIPEFLHEIRRKGLWFFITLKCGITVHSLRTGKYFTLFENNSHLIPAPAIDCLHYLPGKNNNDFRYFKYSV